ncbi:MAG: hypothetical protein HY515_01895, partial [Candidatus Aenigmarchaeota archaeon]|nr:hypothetical protein [Candidatus Aenigmarchaeota archaeon]
DICGDYNILAWAANYVGVYSCEKRCSQLGCTWENEKCLPSPSICKITSRTTLKEVAVVSSVNNGPADDKNKIVAADDVVTLYAVLKLQSPAGTKWVSNSEITEAVIKGAKAKVEHLDGQVNIKWFQINPEPKHSVGILESCPDVNLPDDRNPDYCWYQNLVRTRFWAKDYNDVSKGYYNADVIHYTQNNFGSGWSVNADTKIGTARYRVATSLNGIIVSSPGEPNESTPHKLKEKFYSNGISDNVHRISRRSDYETTCPQPFTGSAGCKYISYIESYERVPWLWGSSGPQVDRYVGFDCAKLVIGAYRQATEKKITYTTANGLATSPDTKPVVTTQRLKFSLHGLGETTDLNGDPFEVKIGAGENELHIGDLILFSNTANGPFHHTAIFMEDENKNGKLDKFDNIISSCHLTGVQQFAQRCVLEGPVRSPESICNQDVLRQSFQRAAFVIRRFK